MTPRIIAFAGLKSAGKDCAASVLIDHGYRRIPFAGPLKEMLRSLLLIRGCPPSQVMRYTDGDKKEEPTHYLSGHTARHAMQTLGTDWARAQMHGDFWLHSFDDAVALAHTEHKDVVVTDCRFQNEVDHIRKLGGIVWRVNRPEVTAQAIKERAAGTLHPSEAAVLDLTGVYELHNDHHSAEAFRVAVERQFF